MTKRTHWMCEAMAAAAESPASPEPPQAHGLTTSATPSAAVGADGPGDDVTEWCDGAKEFCERQVESDTVPRAEYDRVVKLNHHLREAAVMAISERVPSDSKPTNFHNPESEDTPPHNPVLGPIVGTATVKHQTSCPAATAPTVPPEVGKRYVCRNGVVTPLMKSDTLTGRNQPYYFCDIDGTTTYWGHDGRGYVGRQDDLIAEYHEPEPSPPAESPDVSGEIRGLKYALQWIDAKRAGNPKLKVAAWEMLNDMQVHFEAAVARLQDGESINSTSHVDKPAESPDDWVVITDPEHKARIGIDWFETDTGWILQSEKHIDCTVGEFAELSGGKRHCCRRKDLPVVPADNPLPHTFAVGDTVKGSICWPDGSPQECKIVKLDAGISRDAFVVETPFGQQEVMLRQSIVEHVPADKPRMRTVTLREYQRGDGALEWTTRKVIPNETGRTAVVEVPE